jgi:hypothetical protein
MLWWRKRGRSFDINSLPRMDLEAGPVPVEINYLANEAHTEAFVAIFERVLSDNAALLSGCVLAAVEGKHPINFPESLAVPFSLSGLVKNEGQLARVLYMSKNDEVLLVLQCGKQPRRLFVAFDDPYFLLS